MKKIITLVLIAGLFSCIGEKNRYTISGTVSGVNTEMVKLLALDNGAYKVIDSVQSNEGSFIFKGTVKQPDRYYIQLQNSSNYFGFFLENSDIQIKLDKNNLNTPLVTGSQTHDLYENFLHRFESVYLFRIDSVRNLYNDVKDETERNIVDKLFDQKNREAVDFIISFSKEHNNSVVTPYIARRFLYSLVGYNTDDLTNILNSLNNQLSHTQSYELLSGWVEKTIRVDIGMPFADFTMNDTTGNSISVSSINAKCLLIDFWSSSCAPCREMNPHLVKIYDKYTSEGFEILGVSFDKNKEDWTNAINHDKTNWIQVSSLTGWRNQAQDTYGIQYLPQNVLVVNGIITAKNLNKEQIEKKLAELFNR